MSLLTNLVSYWKLDEASGDAADAHGSNTLTNNNSTAFATGKINNGANLVRTSSNYFSKASPGSDFNCGAGVARSCSFWFKTDSISGVGMTVTVWGTVGNRGSIVYLNGSTLTFNVRNGSNVTKTSITTGTWYHIVWTKSTSGTIKLYVNNAAAISGTEGSDTGNAANFYIGENPGQGQYFDGIIDEVGWWTRELSSTDVTTLYNAGAGFAYPFSAGGPTTYPAMLLDVL